MDTNIFKAALMFIVLALGGLYVWRYERGPSAIDAGKDGVIGEGVQSSLFLGLEAGKIEKVKVEYQDVSYGFVSKGAALGDAQERSWVMLEPANAPTDPESISNALDSIVDLRVFNTIEGSEQGKDLSLYGLQTPQLKLSLWGESGEHHLNFGKKHAFSGRRYAQLEGENRIVLLDEANFQGLRKTPLELRDRHPLSFSKLSVSKMVVRRAVSDQLIFTKEGNNTEFSSTDWKVQSKKGDFAVDTLLLADVLDALSDVTVGEFIDSPVGDLDVYGLNDSVLMVQLAVNPTEDSGVSTKQKIVQAIFGTVSRELGDGDKVTQHYLKLNDGSRVYKISKRYPRDLLQPAEHFRDKTPFNKLLFKDLKRVEIRKKSDSEKLVLYRKSLVGKEAHWMVRASDDVAPQIANNDRVQHWLEVVENLRVLSYPAFNRDVTKEFGFDSPVLEISLFFDSSSGGSQHRLLIGSELSKVLQSKALDTSSELQSEGLQSIDSPVVGGPRYGAFEVNTQGLASFVIGFSTWSVLDRHPLYFIASNSSNNE